MKVLVLGCAGMLGHKLYQVLSPDFDVTGTIRGPYSSISKYGFFRPARVVADTDALDISRLEKVIGEIAPDVVVNCIGIIKSREKQSGELLNIQVNALLPNQIYKICRDGGIRIINISTD